MNTYRIDIFHLLQEVVFEVFTWIMLLPKTLIKVLIRPPWIFSYVDQELEREPDDQFQDYLAPGVFWLLVAVIPTIYLALREGAPTAVIPLGPLTTTTPVFSIALMLVGPPSFCAIMEAARRVPLEKFSLRRLFYMQCYVLSPVALIEIVLSLLLAINQRSTVLPLEMIALGFGAVAIGELTMMVSQSVWFRRELGVGWLRAFGLVLLSMAVRLILALWIAASVSIMIAMPGLVGT